MTEHIEIDYLDLEDLIALATALLGSPPPIRDVGLLGSAAARPRTTAFGADAYPDIWTKAASLLQSIVGNHALIDGNKRLGWLATAVFLDINGHSVAEADNNAVYDLVIHVASANPSLDEIAAALEGVGTDDWLVARGFDTTDDAQPFDQAGAMIETSP